MRTVVMWVVLSTLGASVTSAQTFQTLVDFNGANGSEPSRQSPIVRAANGDVYGTTLSGGTQGGGTVFQVSPSGAFRALFNFCLDAPCDAFNPSGVIVGSDGNLYGAATTENSDGTIFKLTRSGSFTTLYKFCSLPNCADGAAPLPPVQGSDGNFYGTTGAGGAFNGGTVFKLTPSGSLTTLYNFCSLHNCFDGESPTGMLQGGDGDFYGITGTGGNNVGGTVFKITPTGILTTLYRFCSVAKCADGEQPVALIQGSDGDLYGTTSTGGTNVQCFSEGGGCGTVFQLTPSGTLTTLYNFCSLAKCADGSTPLGLVLGSDGNFYGTTYFGGASRSVCSPLGCGTFFQLTRSSVLTTLYNFCRVSSSCTDGELPLNLVQTSKGTFFGTTWKGGEGCNKPGCGTFWSWSTHVALAPPFTPGSQNFGNQAVNTTSVAKLVTIKNVNIGFATLDFSNFTVKPPFAISSNTCGTTLAAGKTCVVSITFTPTVLGPVTETLSIADNAPGSPQTVALSGTGVAQATVSPTSLTFGTVKVGTTSAAKKITLKNNLPTTLTGISYSTASPFAVSASTSGTTLASKTSCTISVTFSDHNWSGDRDVERER